MNKTAHESIWRRHRRSTKIDDNDDDDDEFCGSTTRPREAFTVYLWRVRGHYVYRCAVWLFCLSLAGQRCASPPPESPATCDRTETLTASRLIPLTGLWAAALGCMNKSVSNLFVCGDSLLPFYFFFSFLFIFRKETLVKTAAVVSQSACVCGSHSNFILSAAHLHSLPLPPPPAPSHFSFGSSCGRESNSCIYWFTCLRVSPCCKRGRFLHWIPCSRLAQRCHAESLCKHRHTEWSDKWWVAVNIY